MMHKSKTGLPAAPQYAHGRRMEFSAKLSWREADGDVASYIVEKRIAGSSKWTFVNKNVNTTSYIVQGLQKKVPYEFAISSKNAYGLSKRYLVRSHSALAVIDAIENSGPSHRVTGPSPSYSDDKQFDAGAASAGVIDATEKSGPSTSVSGDEQVDEGAASAAVIDATEKSGPSTSVSGDEQVDESAASAAALKYALKYARNVEQATCENKANGVNIEEEEEDDLAKDPTWQPDYQSNLGQASTSRSTSTSRSESPSMIPMSPETERSFREARRNAESPILGGKIYIAKCKRTAIGTRLYNKKNACFVCEDHRMFAKIAQHLRDKHYAESEVMEAYSHPPGSKERKFRLERLRLKGNHFHNYGVLQRCDGELLVLRRPGEGEDDADPANYLPCKFCYGYVLKTNLADHVSTKCIERQQRFLVCPENEREKMSRTLASECSLLLPSSSSTSVQKFVFSRLELDEVGRLCRQDRLICEYAQRLLNKTDQQADYYHYISQKIRLLARIVLELRGCEQATKSEHLGDFLKPQHFDNIIQSVKNICGFEIGGSVDRPTPSLKSGQCLKKCAILKQGLAIRTGDATSLQEAKDVIYLIESEWADQLSSRALANMRSKKYSKEDIMPVVNDLQVLRDYLERQLPILIEVLAEDSSYTNWRALAEATYVRTTTFNFRRSGEVAKMVQVAFTEKWGARHGDQLITDLTPVEQKLCERLAIIHIRGKHGRRVPLIMTPDMVKAMNALVQYRTASCVKETNKYMFANSTEGHVRGDQALSNIAKMIDGIQEADLITMQRLRRYVCTVSQVMSLNDEELDWLARHMGHDIKVHREFYRLHHNTLELARVSKLLLAVDQGKAGRFQGMNLREIDIDAIPHTEEDDGADIPDPAELPEPAERSEASVDLLSESTLFHNSDDEVVPSTKSAATRKAKTTEKAASKCKVQKKPFIRRKPCQKNNWSVDEVLAMRAAFERDYIFKKQRPPGHVVEAAKRKYPILEKRSYETIRQKVRRMIEQFGK